MGINPNTIPDNNGSTTSKLLNDGWMMLWKNLDFNTFILLRNRSEGNAEPEF
jgi:hypothetical protein